MKHTGCGQASSLARDSEPVSNPASKARRSVRESLIDKRLPGFPVGLEKPGMPAPVHVSKHSCPSGENGSHGGLKNRFRKESRFDPEVGHRHW